MYRCGPIRGLWNLECCRNHQKPGNDALVILHVSFKENDIHRDLSVLSIFLWMLSCKTIFFIFAQMQSCVSWYVCTYPPLLAIIFFHSSTLQKWNTWTLYLPEFLKIFIFLRFFRRECPGFLSSAKPPKINTILQWQALFLQSLSSSFGNFAKIKLVSCK